MQHIDKSLIVSKDPAAPGGPRPSSVVSKVEQTHFSVSHNTTLPPPSSSWDGAFTITLRLWGALKACLIKAMMMVIPSPTPAFASLRPGLRGVTYSSGCLVAPRELFLYHAISNGNGGELRLQPACLSFLGTYSLKQLNETFSGGGGRRPLFRMPGPLPSVKHSPNMQLCKRPGGQSSEQPAARGAGIPWGCRDGGTARRPLRQAGPEFAGCQEGPAPGYVVGRRIWPTVGL